MTIPYKKCTKEEIAQLGGPNIVSASYDDGPNDVGDKFAEYLIRLGFQVTILANDNIPTIYYQIIPPACLTS